MNQLIQVLVAILVSLVTCNHLNSKKSKRSKKKMKGGDPYAAQVSPWHQIDEVQLAADYHALMNATSGFGYKLVFFFLFVLACIFVPIILVKTGVWHK